MLPWLLPWFQIVLSAQISLRRTSTATPFRPAVHVFLYPKHLVFPKHLLETQTQLDIDILPTYVFVCCLFIPLEWELLEGGKLAFFTVVISDLMKIKTLRSVCARGKYVLKICLMELFLNSLDNHDSRCTEESYLSKFLGAFGEEVLQSFLCPVKCMGENEME